MFYRIRTRACKKCGGDLAMERDRYGTYIACIQCGAVCTDIDLAHPARRILDEHKKATQPKSLAVTGSHR